MSALLSHPNYRADIDGLRAIAVMAVVAFHAFPSWMGGGFIGVDIFFVISGFLISTIIFENLDKGTFRFSEFYARRIKRIFPALSTVLVACLLFGWFSLLPDELHQLGKHVTAGAGFVSNFVLWAESGYFDNSAEMKPLLHLWSLGIEEQFYIFWPFLIWLAWRSRMNVYGVIGLLGLGSFVCNIATVYHDPVAAFYSPLTRFWELLCGAVLARYALDSTNAVSHGSLISSKQKKFFTFSLDRRFQFLKSDVLACTGSFLLILGFTVINKELSFPGHVALLPVLGTFLLIAAGPRAWINRSVLSNKILVWIGLISFPLYLWHWPILSFGRIIYFDAPPLKFKVAAVVASFILAWLTMTYIEKPCRFRGGNALRTARWLFVVLMSLAAVGGLFLLSDFSTTHSIDKLSVKRKGEHAIGSSLAWYQGKEDWLFLGNAHDHTVAKLKLATIPSETKVNEVKNQFSKLADQAARHGVKTVLIVGPNKSSIYPEYLPEGLHPSAKRYSSFFFEGLRELQNLVLYDPTNDLLAAKASNGLLYWKTDTHWNDKGAYLTYVGFSKLLGLPYPLVDFKPGAPHRGDLIDISKLKNFPVDGLDSWDGVWNIKPVWNESVVTSQQKTSFGDASLVTNDSPLSHQNVWVLGDSFTWALKPYFNASFGQVRYLGYSAKQLAVLAEELDKAHKKPDLVVIVRVERSF